MYLGGLDSSSENRGSWIIGNGSEFDLAWFFKIKLAALPGGALNTAKGALGAPIFRDFVVRFL